MKKTCLSILLAVALAAIPLSAQAADTKMAAGAVDAKASAAIESRMKEFAAAWNKHDAKAMAAVWWENGDLVNPFGAKASGRAEVEQLYGGEQGGVMKASTYTIDSSSLRNAAGGVVVADWDGTVTGMMSPDGQVLPPFPHHVTAVFVNEGGLWRIKAGRGYQLLPPPGK